MPGISRIRRAAGMSALGVTLVVASSACSSSSSAPTGATSSFVAPANSALNLSDVCPSTIVFQQDWYPDAENGGWYSLVGKGYSIDTDKKRVTGELVAGGTDTGVKIQIRSGGAPVQFQPVPALMYLDKSIMVGAVSTDSAISMQAKDPTVAVTSQITVSPQIIMWDPASHPGAKTIKQAASGGDPVVTSGVILPKLMQSKGIITAKQVDTSYEGTPQRFVADPKILQQGFATSEPFTYEHELAQWDKPIAYQLMSEIGYSIYPEASAVRSDAVTGQAACLKKLVPILQQAQIDYLKSPAHADAVILDAVKQFQVSWTYSQKLADFTVQQLTALKLITNDPKSGVFGEFDPTRMKQITETFVPILQGAGLIKGDVDPTSLYTNRFIDPSIKMS